MILTKLWGLNMAIKIYIDQGHNPQSPNAGAEGNGLVEQDLTYEIGTRLASLLRSNGNFEVRVSRPTAETVLGTSNASSLRIRVDEANAFGADYFISLHTNASNNSSASGSEALVYSSPSIASELGEDILIWLNRLTGLRNRGIVNRPGLYVLRKTQMPAVLVEMGFISNANVAALMNNSPELFAEGIYNGILQYTGLL
jgi:N-acetylmuramoyl-L-alanine amidase